MGGCSRGRGFFSELGIALGGAWAYQTLGWGGYWSWDPIETSALIPWLALSAVLFARRQGNENLELFGMTLAMSTLLLISYVARGSSVESLHAYGDLATGLPFILLALFPVFFSLGDLLQIPSVRLPSRRHRPRASSTFLSSGVSYSSQSQTWCCCSSKSSRVTLG